jgi:hypothetical protein
MICQPVEAFSSSLDTIIIPSITELDRYRTAFNARVRASNAWQSLTNLNRIPHEKGLSRFLEIFISNRRQQVGTTSFTEKN